MRLSPAQEKWCNTVTYFVERLSTFSFKKVIKLIYIADVLAIKETGVPINWLKYCASQSGPVPIDLFNTHQEKSTLCHNDFFTIESQTPNHIILRPGKTFDDSRFSDYDIEILDKVIVTYGKYSAEKIIKILNDEHSLWWSTLESNSIQKCSEFDDDKFACIIQFSDLPNNELKQSAFDVAYQSYLMEV